MERISRILNEVMQSDAFLTCDDYIEAGLLDSLQVMELVEALEDEFDIEFSGRDIIPENFSNIKAIAELVEKSGGNI